MAADDGYEAVPHRGGAAPSAEEMAARAEAFRARMATRRTVRDFAPDPVPRSVIEACVATAATAPSGANQQPWRFEAIAEPGLKARIRDAAEEEEKRFYGGGASEEWLEALGPLGTDWRKPHLTDAAWLIVVFAERYGVAEDGRRVKHYYVPESVGIACGFLIAALHGAGLATLTHTPNPMGFLRDVLGRPDNEKAVMIVATGHAAPGAAVPKVAKVKKPLEEILGVRE
ncbi:MAG: nitroreductase family protein [Pseudomonadota bacterium]